MELQVKHLTVLVADMQRSIAFYRDVLGLNAVEVSDYWSEFEAGPVHIGLHPGRTDEPTQFESGTDAGTLNIVLQSPDLDVAIDRLRKRGVDVQGPMNLEGMPPMATFSDPDGISYTLT